MLDFKSWLSNAKRGDSVVYYRSQSLAYDRETSSKTRKASTPILVNASNAWDACEIGLVDLVQRKVESGYEYIAQRR